MAGISGESIDVTARAQRPQSLIVTIYGAYSRQLGGWFPVSSLVDMLTLVDIDQSSVRGALSRRKRRGIVFAERHNGLAGYALAPVARTTFDLGDARVLQRRHPPADMGWVLAAFSIPETKRDVRYRLRSRLSAIGSAQVSGGLWIAPRQLEQDLRHVVSSLQIQQCVDLFTAEHIGFRPSAQVVRQWWDLDAIADLYTSFTKAFRPMANLWKAPARASQSRAAFADYTRALTAWRAIPYLDPGLPAAYLPKSWPGRTGTAVFFDIHDKLAGQALAFAREQIPT